LNLYFDSINWTVGAGKIEVIKEDEPVQSQVGLRRPRS